MESKKRLRPFLILAVSLIAIFSVTAASYAKYQRDAQLLKEPEVTSGDISGKFISLADSPPQVEIPQTSGGTNQPSGPSRLIIPDIGVNAFMESRGVTAGNAVDVPKSLWNVSWFNQSSRPGSPGPAMIVGHYSSYGKAVFSNLHKLKVGQKIIVRDDNNQVYTYAVKSIDSYPQAEVPMAELLGDKQSKPRLSLITCGGQYIKNARDFTNRTVLRAEIV
ncbi:MAG: class F sortase [Candidatus Nomurabacteria bacterium]|nr:MAG: class F sortase [Candidatus Nomurabacteria bacterium]HRV76060.1 class F sortase [Candidatus Saccharimonadales bacterium]